MKQSSRGSKGPGPMKRNSRKRLWKLRFCLGENPAYPGKTEGFACPTSYTWQFHSARNGNTPRCPARSVRVNAKKVLGAGLLLSRLNPPRSKRAKGLFAGLVGPRVRWRDGH